MSSACRCSRKSLLFLPAARTRAQCLFPQRIELRIAAHRILASASRPWTESAACPAPNRSFDDLAIQSRYRLALLVPRDRQRRRPKDFALEKPNAGAGFARHNAAPQRRKLEPQRQIARAPFCSQQCRTLRMSPWKKTLRHCRWRSSNPGCAATQMSLRRKKGAWVRPELTDTRPSQSSSRTILLRTKKSQIVGQTATQVCFA
mmetsp:Transcript_11361/g.30617  ORF Transcript_11361/g.30617 Transcript_11361/m.30617 type:complete len:203 (-) Transcript_11361:829-1437(-)